MICSLATPVLLVWGYSLWNKRSRKELPQWRNGMGLASITFIFASWVIQVAGLVMVLSRIYWQGFENIDWYVGRVEVYLLPLAPFFTIGFKGLPRLQVFTAGILVWVLEASLVYA
jgi:hypothetical protein